MLEFFWRSASNTLASSSIRWWIICRDNCVSCFGIIQLSTWVSGAVVSALWVCDLEPVLSGAVSGTFPMPHAVSFPTAAFTRGSRQEYASTDPSFTMRRKMEHLREEMEQIGLLRQVRNLRRVYAAAFYKRVTSCFCSCVYNFEWASDVWCALLLRIPLRLYRCVTWVLRNWVTLPQPPWLMSLYTVDPAAGTNPSKFIQIRSWALGQHWYSHS